MTSERAPQKESYCRVCGHSGLVPKWEVGQYHVGNCPKCTAMLVTNAPTLKQLEEYYATVSDPAYYENNREQLGYYYQKLGKMVRGLRPNGRRIFDVGCSRGWFMDAMTGWDCHGNELNEFEAGEARRQYGDNIIQGPFETCPDYDEPFDVVTIQDVLDHFIDPVAVIRKANSMLKPGGLMVIKVHDFGCLWAKLTGKKFYAVIPPSHLTYFNERSLRILCEGNGFKVDKTCHLSQAIAIPTIFFGSHTPIGIRFSEKSAKCWKKRSSRRSRSKRIFTISSHCSPRRSPTFPPRKRQHSSKACYDRCQLHC